MRADKQTSQFLSELRDLRYLLEKQIEMARQGNINDVEILGEQVGFLVEKIAQTGILELADPAFNAGQRERLAKLYDSLCLAITAAKTETSEKLNRVRKGRRTIETYRSSI